MAGSSLRLAMVAGEASGDLLAGLLLGGLRARWPALTAQGIGGPRMAAQGFESWSPHHRLSVMGLAQALPRLPELLRTRSRLGDRLLTTDRPELFIGVDAPDFNLALEARLKQGGVKAVHFVSPSIWAWRPERVHKIGAATDHVLCLFPFEPELYHRHGYAATFVGHPLADAIPMDVPRAASRLTLGLNDSQRVVALLPGSRPAEVAQIAPLLLQAARLMRAQASDLHVVLPVAPGLKDAVQVLVDRHAAGTPIQLLDGGSHLALAACDVTLVASGTATLEAALFKRPMVITYRLGAWDWHWMRRKMLQPWVGLPNILLSDFAVPELLQDAATPERLAAEGLAWLNDPARCAALVDRLIPLHHSLRQNTAQAATDAIEKILAA
jgi:lipid-A-disaccharide synthase